MSASDTVVVLDFETTGLSPNLGDRAIEIGAVKIENGVIVDRFQELMYPGQRVSTFIETYTGISNVMLGDARPCSAVMDNFADFIEDFNLVAHNASFDKRFLDYELGLIARSYSGQFLCSMLTARRMYQDALNHQLGTLISHMNILSEGEYHRALYDSEMTAKLWIAMLDKIRQRTGLSMLPVNLIQKLMKMPKHSVDAFLEKTGGLQSPTQ